MLYAVILLCIVVVILLFELSRRTLKISGTMVITETDEKITYLLELEEEPEEFQFRDKIVFKIEHSGRDL